MRGGRKKKKKARRDWGSTGEEGGKKCSSGGKREKEFWRFMSTKKTNSKGNKKPQRKVEVKMWARRDSNP